MATQRQKKLARAIVQNMKSKTPKTAGELLESVGYAQNTAEAKPGEIIEQKGVQEELTSLGFTEDKAKAVVASIMNNETVDPNSRLKAADMTFKVHGSYAPEKRQNLDVIYPVDSLEELKKLAKEISQGIKDKYTHA